MRDWLLIIQFGRYSVIGIQQRSQTASTPKRLFLAGDLVGKIRIVVVVCDISSFV